MGLFKKPHFGSTSFKEDINQDVDKILETLHSDSTWEKKITLEKTAFEERWQREKDEKASIIKALDTTIALKRNKRDEAERPLIEFQKELNDRENALALTERTLFDETQKIRLKERDTERKLEDVQALSDQLGEVRRRHLVKEGLLIHREEMLKDKEMSYLTKIEKFSREVNESAAKIQERQNEVLMKELNIESKEENLKKREKELLDGHAWLNDQRAVLQRAWNELTIKTHDSSTEFISKGR